MQGLQTYLTGNRADAVYNGPPGKGKEVSKMAKFEIYADRGGKYRWRLTASNGEKIATSGESFASRYNAARAARGVKKHACHATTP